MGVFQKHCSKWKKADRESNYYVIVYVTLQNRQNCNDRNHINICQELGRGEKIGYKRAFSKLKFDESILSINCVSGYMIINIYQNTWNCTSTWKLYFKNPTLKKKRRLT